MSTISPGAVIGILGGGQLGRMTAQAAQSLGYKTHVFCDVERSPATQVCDEATIAAYDDKEALAQFAEQVEVVTAEFENIPYETAKFLADLLPVRPKPDILHIAQHRLREKQFMKDNDVAVTPFIEVKSAEELKEGLATLGASKALLKTVELGYDGKGQQKVTSEDDFDQIWQNAGVDTGILEAFVDFEQEISVIVARGLEGEMQAFPPAENTHLEGILDTSIVPANISTKVADEAQEIAKYIAEKLDVIGLVAVEFFVTKEHKLLVNEIAPRPHNSGHWTMDGAVTSQFEQCVRAICGLPLGSPEMHSHTRMKNLLGKEVEQWEEIIANHPNAKVHLYGKKEARERRKMGHVNFIEPLEDGKGSEDNGSATIIPFSAN